MITMRMVDRFVGFSWCATESTYQMFHGKITEPARAALPCPACHSTCFVFVPFFFIKPTPPDTNNMGDEEGKKRKRKRRENSDGDVGLI